MTARTTLVDMAAYLSVRIGFVAFIWNTCITLSPPQVMNLDSSIQPTSIQPATLTIRPSHPRYNKGAFLPLSAGYSVANILLAMCHN